ncbi:MAG: hypothetical protein O9352_19550 [Rhizobium sp.]|nr:hypothetical protein [Rhizobium sp.]
MTNSTLRTANEAWGFYGNSSAFADADAAWAIVFPAIAKVTMGSAEGVRDFLDSRQGRHFADDVHNGLHTGLDLGAAIAAAITRWMGWKIDRNTAREHGIPKGLPYLTGFVGLYEIMAEAE